MSSRVSIKLRFYSTVNEKQGGQEDKGIQVDLDNDFKVVNDKKQKKKNKRAQ